MIEGLAVWALFIYLLRLVGMPWNKVTQSFAYIGGISWLMFVWVGLINYTPMDISGGSVVQSPHIQLRPDSPNVTGKVSKIYVDPNQTIQKGQLIYEIDATPYQIAFNQAMIAESAAKVALESANGDVEIAKASYQSMLKDITVSHSQLASAREDYLLQKKMLERYREQNRVVKNTITQADMDKQSTTVQVANQNLTTIESQLAKKQVDADKAKLAITQAQLTITQRENDLGNARETVAKARWDLNSTKVYAPADGFVTNFILREGQRIAMMPRLQMYTNEKYVLMRVNHQAIRNIKAGQLAEFASSVYPGKVFSATVEGIVEATGEAQSNLLGFDQNVTATSTKLTQQAPFCALKN